MSIFKNILNVFSDDSKSGSDHFDWGKVSSSSDLNAIDEASYKKIQLIYKHSTRCATSYFALRSLQELSEKSLELADLYNLDVIGQRTLSNEISEKYHVRHESPQVILIKEGKAVWDGSHGEVRSEIIEEVLERV